MRNLTGPFTALSTKEASCDCHGPQVETRRDAFPEPQPSGRVVSSVPGEGLGRADIAFRKKDPEVLIPARMLSNVAFNEKTRHVEMGDAKQSRSFFNYGQAKRFMQTLLVASKCKDLIDRGKTASIRQIYYLSKHTIKGTSEKTFDDQAESDPIIEDVEVAIDALPEELHVFASNRGILVGPVTLVDAVNTPDCTAMGSAGYAVPSICEAAVVQFQKG